MKSRLIALLLTVISTSLFAGPLTYQPDANQANGKKLVFIASDHEYRSEETLPALARIMAKHHGFECVVVFGIDEKDGTIVAGKSNLPGIEALDDADGLVIFTRFLAPPDEQMKHLDAYLNHGGPVVALRTSTHVLRYPKDSERS